MTKQQTEKLIVPPASSGAVVPYDYSQFEGSGFENTSEKDLSTPYLVILQTNSKPCKASEANHVPGAQGGMFLNTSSRELIPGATGFSMVPLHIDHCVVEWLPNRSFKARHPIDSPLWVAAKARFEADQRPDKRLSKDVKTPEGNPLSETYYLWSLLLDQDGETPVSGAILPFKSTNIGIYRKQVYTPLYSFKGAGNKLFVHRLRCTLAAEKRPDGDSFNYRFQPLNGSIRDSLIDPRSELMAVVYRTYREVVEGKTKMATEDPSDVTSTIESAPDEVFS